MALSRRRVVAGLGAAATAAPVGSAPSTPPDPVTAPAGHGPHRLAQDERFWREVARQYRVSGQFTNLENGYYGITPAAVRHAYRRNADRLNTLSSYLLRSTYKAEADQVRERTATLAGVDKEEIAFTRGGTEALQNLIGGYRLLRPGDAVMYADLDYHSARYAMNWLRDRRGVDAVRITVPEPATAQAVIDTYTRALDQHPRVKLLLLTHVNNVTGLALPISEIATAARDRGVDVIADAAHSWGQPDFAICSLHKWMGAPLGTGFLYIRKGRLGDIDRAFADETYPADDIRSRVHSGTLAAAAVLTVPAALDFHQALGSAVKQARLRYLRDRWVHQVQDITNLDILTPDHPASYGAITSFRVRGHTTQPENIVIAQYLFDQHQILTVR
ncbi:aminotransferase class V-fold PLP-dependent enzyme [Streptomyces sp. ActVer]|uniref:aminotransferase class V-fold PLP-dependent enzyme n=1 Tax=Streptomyces sp. ActVer TaxID=3014558 RepID=UPI0022B56EF6|nr:aminotransferase class V-fold PLP-dependent enzyme [Streptomyces sp. ActVer]MCZ4513582.1 aminotransferase class V-fold PLP-dependent enzyme [Streptomyces sp. ActVer]